MYRFTILVSLHTSLLNICHREVQLRSSISHNSIHLRFEVFQSLLQSHATMCINCRYAQFTYGHVPGRVAQSVTCLATDACLTADPGVTSSIPVRSHTFVVIDHEMISTVILLPSADSFKKGCCQLQVKECARITG